MTAKVNGEEIAFPQMQSDNFVGLSSEVNQFYRQMDDDSSGLRSGLGWAVALNTNLILHWEYVAPILYKAAMRIWNGEEYGVEPDPEVEKRRSKECGYDYEEANVCVEWKIVEISHGRYSN